MEGLCSALVWREVFSKTLFRHLGESLLESFPSSTCLLSIIWVNESNMSFKNLLHTGYNAGCAIACHAPRIYCSVPRS